MHLPKVAYRVTRSRRMFFQYAPFRREVEQTIDRKTKPELIAEHDKVVADWVTEIEFKARKFVTKKSITVNVFPAGENKMIWVYVTQGTRPHRIAPKRPGYPLRFKWGGPGSYKPRTTPAPSYGGPGKVAGGKTVRFAAVNHPGNKPRPFPAKIARDYKKTFSRDMNNAMRRGIRRARSG